MSIYTKTGDTGTTALFGGKRIWKYDTQVEAYGITDEATCFIGFALEVVVDQQFKEFLSDIQVDLYVIMGYLAGADFPKNKLTQHIVKMEQYIDQLDKSLPKLTRFILPQGSEVGVRLHIARAKVRSAERRIVEFTQSNNKQSENDLLMIQYMNRLSDFLFVLARKYTPEEKRT